MSTIAEQKVSENDAAVRIGDAEGIEEGFDAEKARNRARKAKAKAITTATMVAAGLVPGTTQFPTPEVATKWLHNVANAHYNVANAAE